MTGWGNVSFLSVTGCLPMYFMAVTKSIKLSGYVIYSYFKDSAFAALTKGQNSLNWVCVRGTIRQ